jgi:WD40 repeat protein
LAVGAAFSQDGKHVMIALYDGTVQIWDPATGQATAVLKGSDQKAMSVAFSADGKRVAMVSADKAAVWDTAAGAETVLKGHSRKINSAAFSPDGQRLVTASDDTTARIWDAATGASITVLKGHQGQVTSASFSPDGRRVLTSSNDSTAAIWDATTGTQLAVFKGNTAVVVSAAFSPNGRRVMTVASDGAVWLWDVATVTPIAVLRKSDFSHMADTPYFNPDGRSVVTMANNSGRQLVEAWPIAPTTQDLVDDTKTAVPRCLTPAQRDEAFLDPVPPAWCIEMEKWPYQTQDWKDWLKYKQANANPPLPDTAAWQSWATAHKTK